MRGNSLRLHIQSRERKINEQKEVYRQSSFTLFRLAVFSFLFCCIFFCLFNFFFASFIHVDVFKEKLTVLRFHGVISGAAFRFFLRFYFIFFHSRKLLIFFCCSKKIGLNDGTNIRFMVYMRVWYVCMSDIDANGNLEDNTDFTSFYFASVLFVSIIMMVTELGNKQH